MSDELRESLRLRTKDTAARFAPASLPVEPAQVGDIRQCEATADALVEWVVIAVDPERSCLLVVPADINPETGGGDMVLPDDAACGPLVLRCAWATWVPSCTFAAAPRTGRLTTEECEQAAAQVDMIVTGGAEAFRTVVADRGTLEYAEWIEQTIEPACTRLQAAGQDRPAGTAWRKTRWLAAAAALLVAASVALLTGLEIKRRHLQTALYDIASAHSELEARSREWPELEKELRARIKELNQQQSTVATEPGDTALENLSYAWLRPAEAKRGQSSGKPVEIPKEARFLVLLLELTDQETTRSSEPAPLYRLRLLEDDSGTTRWESGTLRPTGVSEICVALPTRILGSGSFTLVLSSASEQQPHVVRHYRLTLSCRQQ